MFAAGEAASAGTALAFTAPPVGQFSSNGVTVIATVDPAVVANLTSVDVLYGLDVGDGTFLVLGKGVGGVIDAATGQVGGNLPLLRYELSVDGFATSLLAYYSVTPNPENPDVLVLNTPVGYFPPGVTDSYVSATLQVSFDANTLEVLGKGLFSTTDAGNVSELAVDPAGTLQTLIPLVAADGSISLVNSGQFDDPPSIPATLDTLDAGFDPTEPGDGSFLSTAPIAAGVSIANSAGDRFFQLVAVPTV